MEITFELSSLKRYQQVETVRVSKFLSRLEKGFG